MSDRQCQAGDTQGFPLRISQKLYSEWPGVDFPSVSSKLKSITVPCEYSVNWPTPSYNANITVEKGGSEHSILQVSGLDPYTSQTTMTYRGASYKCSNVLSIIQNQHKFFSNEPRTDFEVILSFQIKSKDEYPSSPDVILFCRPLIISDGQNFQPMWKSIDKASFTSKSQFSTIDLSSIYAYNPSTLLPFITYQTCIPTKVIPNTGPAILGSLRMRVNVSTIPLRLNLESRDLSTSVKNYTLPTNPVGLFSTTSLTPPIIQFKDGNGTDGFPIHAKTNLKISLPTTILTDFDSVINSITIQVPEAFLGKSLVDISSAVPPKVNSKNKAYKCYTVDPTKDIVNGQIMVDPTTGESLSDAQIEEEFGDSYDIDTDVETGIMPGDIEYVLSITVTVLGTLGLLGYLLFIILEGRNVFNTGEEGGMRKVLIHIVIFMLIFAGLILFGIYFVKPEVEKKNS